MPAWYLHLACITIRLTFVMVCVLQLCMAITTVPPCFIYISRLMIVSREAKKKQAVRDEQVSYLHVAPL